MLRTLRCLAIAATILCSEAWAFRDCPDCPEMVKVPAGKFMMGSPHDEEYRREREGPRHEVTIAKPLAAGKYEVTVAEFKAFVDATGRDMSGGCRYRSSDRSWKQDEAMSWLNHIFRQTDREPVVCVSWYDAAAYVGWLSARTGKPYRLPSEAEWEYMARAGTDGPFHFGNTISTKQANYDGTGTYGFGGRQGVSRRRTVPAGSFPPNAFGLHDVHGNAAEWTRTCAVFIAYRKMKDYSDGPPVAAAHTDRCRGYVGRGGSWGNHPAGVRSAERGYWLASRR